MIYHGLDTYEVEESYMIMINSIQSSLLVLACKIHYVCVKTM